MGRRCCTDLLWGSVCSCFFPEGANFLFHPPAKLCSPASASPALPGAPALVQSADQPARFLPSSPQLPALAAPWSKCLHHAACPGIMVSHSPHSPLPTVASPTPGPPAPLCPSEPLLCPASVRHSSQTIEERLQTRQVTAGDRSAHHGTRRWSASSPVPPSPVPLCLRLLRARSRAARWAAPPRCCTDPLPR